MTDRELLEAAAKAAGIEHPGGEHSIANDGRLWDCNGLRWWNPLTDNGDAFRLAVKLRMMVDVNVCFVEVVWHDSDLSEMHDLQEDWGEGAADDAVKQGATRRAITRAAAEIGKAQP